MDKRTEKRVDKLMNMQKQKYADDGADTCTFEGSHGQQEAGKGAFAALRKHRLTLRHP